MAGGSVYGAAAVFQDLAEAAESPISRQMTEPVVNQLQSIEVQKYKGKFAGGAAGPADFRMQYLEKAAMIWTKPVSESLDA